MSLQEISVFKISRFLSWAFKFDVTLQQKINRQLMILTAKGLRRGGILERNARRSMHTLPVTHSVETC